MAAKEEQYFHPLAKDERGLGFALPGDARFWRVQRMPARGGKTSPVYTDDGPLQVKIEIPSIDELKSAIRETPRGIQGGRYKLVPVDAQGVQVGNKCGYTPPLEPEGGDAPADDDEEDALHVSGRDAVIVKLADRIVERDTKLMERYAALADKAHALAEKAFEVIGSSHGNLTKGYVQVRPVTLDPPEIGDDDGADDDEKDLIERLINAGPALGQLWTAIQAVAASRKENMAAAAAAAAGAAAAAPVDTNGVNGTNGVHVGIKRPADDGGQGAP